MKAYIEVDGDIVHATRSLQFRTKAEAEAFVKKHYADAPYRIVPESEMPDVEFFEHEEPA